MGDATMLAHILSLLRPEHDDRPAVWMTKRALAAATGLPLSRVEEWRYQLPAQVRGGLLEIDVSSMVDLVKRGPWIRLAHVSEDDRDALSAAGITAFHLPWIYSPAARKGSHGPWIGADDLDRARATRARARRGKE